MRMQQHKIAWFSLKHSGIGRMSRVSLGFPDESRLETGVAATGVVLGHGDHGVVVEGDGDLQRCAQADGDAARLIVVLVGGRAAVCAVDHGAHVPET